ncbi:MAG: hypothetical protein Q9167_007814 [Letrouitia subvulpina]
MSCVNLFQIPLRSGISSTDAIEGLRPNFEKQPGFVKLRAAPQHEDKKILGIAIQFSNFQAYQDWSHSDLKSKSEELINGLFSHEGALYEDVVVFPGDAGSALDAPAAELVSWIYATDGLDDAKRQKIDRGFAAFADPLQAQAPETAGGAIAGWSQLDFTYEGKSRARRFTALIGWKSVEAHYACKETRPFLDNIHNIMDLNHIGIEMVHYSFSAV